MNIIENENDNYVELYYNFLEQPLEFDDEHDLTINAGFINYFLGRIRSEQTDPFENNINYRALNDYLQLAGTYNREELMETNFELYICLYHITMSINQIYDPEIEILNLNNIHDSENFAVTILNNIKILQQQAPELFEVLNDFILSVLIPATSTYVLKGGLKRKIKNKTKSNKKKTLRKKSSSHKKKTLRKKLHKKLYKKSKK